MEQRFEGGIIRVRRLRQAHVRRLRTPPGRDELPQGAFVQQHQGTGAAIPVVREFVNGHGCLPGEFRPAGARPVKSASAVGSLASAGQIRPLCYTARTGDDRRTREDSFHVRTVDRRAARHRRGERCPGRRTGSRGLLPRRDGFGEDPGAPAGGGEAFHGGAGCPDRAPVRRDRDPDHGARRRHGPRRRVRPFAGRHRHVAREAEPDPRGRPAQPDHHLPGRSSHGRPVRGGEEGEPLLPPAPRRRERVRRGGHRDERGRGARRQVRDGQALPDRPPGGDGRRHDPRPGRQAAEVQRGLQPDGDDDRLGRNPRHHNPGHVLAAGEPRLPADARGPVRDDRPGHRGRRAAARAGASPPARRSSSSTRQSAARSSC